MDPRNCKSTQCLNSDIISTLPERIIEKILTLIPMRDAIRTGILSRKWRYSWRGMPNLVFKVNIVPHGYDYSMQQVSRHRPVNAIFHAISSHNDPAILDFSCSLVQFQLVSEIDMIMKYIISRGCNVKELNFLFKDQYCSVYQTRKDNYNTLPASFFSIQGLERIHLRNCVFKPPPTFDGFKRLRRISFANVHVSVETLQRFLSSCPLLDEVILQGDCKEHFEFTRGSKFTFVELLQCLPFVKILDISKYYMKYLAVDGMLHKLPTSLAQPRYLYLDVCLMEHYQISSVLCMMRSFPLLVETNFRMYDNDKLPVGKTPTNFLDPKNHSDLKLDHLEILEIQMFRKLPVEMEFVKLIMAKSPVLKKVRLELSEKANVEEELKVHRDLLRVPFRMASPFADIIVERPKAKSANY